MSNVKGVYLSRDQWTQLRQLLDSHLYGTIGAQMDGENTGPVEGWIYIDTDLTTYDDDGEVVTMNDYDYIYLGYWTWWDAKEKEWDVATDAVKVIGPYGEKLDTGKQYWCVYTGMDGDVADNNIDLPEADPEATPPITGFFPLDVDGVEVAPVWMAQNPTHCQPMVKCDQNGPRTVYMQMPTEYEASTCSGTTDEEFVIDEPPE